MGSLTRLWPAFFLSYTRLLMWLARRIKNVYIAENKVNRWAGEMRDRRAKDWKCAVWHKNGFLLLYRGFERTDEKREGNKFVQGFTAPCNNSALVSENFLFGELFWMLANKFREKSSLFTKRPDFSPLNPAQFTIRRKISTVFIIKSRKGLA